jgi:hypothetical protein
LVLVLAALATDDIEGIDGIADTGGDAGKDCCDADAELGVRVRMVDIFRNDDEGGAGVFDAGE